MGALHERVALITGAGRGIGRAIALAYAAEGARLALAARTRSELERTAQEAQALGAPTCILQADVSDQAQVDDMVRQTVAQFGTIDILVNNAGIGGLTRLWPQTPGPCVGSICPHTHGNPSPEARLDVRTGACYTAAHCSDGTAPYGAEPCHRHSPQAVCTVWLRHRPARAHPEERAHGENQAYRPDYP